MHRLAGRRVHGRLRAQRWSATGDDADATTRRVVGEAFDSFGPNRYVIGIDTERGYVLVHELVPRDAPLDLMEVG